MKRHNRRPDPAPWEATEPTVGTGERVVRVTTMSVADQVQLRSPMLHGRVLTQAGEAPRKVFR